MGLCPECMKQGETTLSVRTALDKEMNVCDRCGKEY